MNPQEIMIQMITTLRKLITNLSTEHVKFRHVGRNVGADTIAYDLTITTQHFTTTFPIIYTQDQLKIWYPGQKPHTTEPSTTIHYADPDCQNKLINYFNTYLTSLIQHTKSTYILAPPEEHTTKEPPKQPMWI